MNDDANRLKIATSRTGRWLRTIAVRSWLIALAVVSVGILPGCTKQVPDSKTGPSVTRTAGSEFLSVTLTVRPETIELGDTARLSLDIEADRHVTLLGHSLDSALAEGDHKFEYRVHPFSTQEAKPTSDGRLQWTYTYDLEFFLAGDFELPAVEVSYLASKESDDGPGDTIDNTERVLATEPLSVSVRLPAGTTLTEAQMREVHRLDPVELSTPWAFPWWLTGFAILVVLATAWFLVRRRQRRQAPEVVVIPAHVWAKQRMAELAAEDLVAHARYREFYYRISDIIRGYVERRFALSAPEMTTDEFLLTAATDPRLYGSITAELGRFLTACDMVKYARHQPAESEATGVFRAAGEFVQATQQRAMDSDQPGNYSTSGERAA